MSEDSNPTTDEATESASNDLPTVSAGTAASVTAKTGVGSAGEQPDASAASNRRVRKSREGVVVSQKMDKTAVVAVVERVRHPKYNKFVLQTKKLYAHDEANDVNVGDRVRVTETRPLSKLKRWRVSQIIERAK
jgi:small subunit ribosomal protein S17